jgi:small subunit ribosomal protein S7
LNLVQKQSGSDPINVLKDAFENIKPQIETKSRRVGGTNYQVPMEVPYRRSTTLAIRWLVGSSRNRGEKTMSERTWKRNFRCKQQNRSICQKKRRCP